MYWCLRSQLLTGSVIVDIRRVVIYAQSVTRIWPSPLLLLKAVDGQKWDMNDDRCIVCTAEVCGWILGKSP